MSTPIFCQDDEHRNIHHMICKRCIQRYGKVGIHEERLVIHHE